MTKTGDGWTRALRPWICSAEVRGGGGGGGNWNTTTKTECKNEVDQPWNWNLPCSVWCMSNKIFTHDYSFLYLLSVIMCERAGQNNC